MKCLSCRKGTIIGNECQSCYKDFETAFSIIDVIKRRNENDKEDI